MQRTYKNIFQNLAKLKFAIILLLVIAGFSILGTIIEQNRSLEFYVQTYDQKLAILEMTIGQAILILGLDHVYSAWWFNTLLILLGVSLISCTVLQQFVLLKKSKVYQFTSKLSTKKNQSIELDSIFTNQVTQNLKRNQYTIFQQKQNIYAYKGLIGRFAPIIVHAAMITILIGTLFAAISGFQSQELIAKGEIIQTQNIVSENILSKIPKDLIRVNDFWVEYGNKSNTKQFYSSISLLNQDGKEKKLYTTKVNYPLRYNELTFYQTDWNIRGLRIKTKTNTIQIPSQSYKNKTTWLSYLPRENSRLIFLQNNCEGYFQVFSETGENLGRFGLNDNIGETNNQIIDVITETGLQIKSDPGIPIIYSGFFLLMVSTLTSYKSYNQYWLDKTKQNLSVNGRTNRAPVNLQRELNKIKTLTKKEKNYT